MCQVKARALLVSCLPMETPIWAEPVRGSYPAPWILNLPGPERGRLIPPPPIQHLFGLRAVRGSEPGTSRFTMPCSPWLLSSAGVYTAGIYALVADAPFGGAIVSKLPAGTFGSTSELSMSFFRTADPSSIELTARARVVEVGRTVGLSEAVVTDTHGRRLAHGTSRYFLRAVPGLPDPPAERPEPKPPAYDIPDPYLRPFPGGVDPEAFSRSGGLALLEAAAAGTQPPAPFARLFGITVTDAAPGATTFSIVASEWLHSPARTIYGGVLAMLADAVMTAAVGTTLDAGQSCATLDLKLHFLRPGIADGSTLRARGEVVHRGRSIAVTRAEILNAEGKPIVLASGSTMVLDRPWASVSLADEPHEDET